MLVPAPSRGALALLAAVLTAWLAGCGGGGGSAQLLHTPTVTVPGPAAAVPAAAPPSLTIATKNTTRFGGGDPAADAAAVALAVFPARAVGTYPAAVTVVPADDWQAALAASVLSSGPLRTPILISEAGREPAATTAALQALQPTGAGTAGGAQIVRIGDATVHSGLRTAAITGAGPYALSAAIDRFSAAAHGGASGNVIIASADDPTFAMPAAGLAAESGEPILFVNSGGIPAPTRQALLSHPHPRIYVLGPPNVISDAVLAQLRRYGTVKRTSTATDPAAASVAFAEYRDPACTFGQPCAHFPGSFGWALRSPGHGYVLLNLHRPLDAAAAAPLSASGDFGPQLLLDDPSRLPKPVLDYFLNYATPGYTSVGPTAAVYNHAWLIGDTSAVSAPVQAQVDQLLEPVAQR